MKKVLLSLFVIVSFVLYSVYEKRLDAILPKSSPMGQSGTSQSARPSSSPPTNSSTWKDGLYTGSTEDVFYGDIQVRVRIDEGKIAGIVFLQYPDDQKTSVMINTEMMPILTQEAIQKQSAEVDIVSGATDSSEGFKRSLAHALAQAK